MGNIYGENKGTGYAGNVWDSDAVSPTLTTMQGGNRQPMIIQNDEVYDVKIRKLTPRECYKLMGLTFKDCDNAKNLGVADTHLYRQAGNGIITNCCELLAEHLYKAQYDNTYICTDERVQGNFTKPQME